MRSILLASLLSAAVTLPTAAFAQEKAKSVDDYLCTFAGKCGDEGVEEVTKDAPETKGFSLTRPGSAKAVKAVPAQQPTKAAAAPARAPASVKAAPPRQVAAKSVAAKKPAVVAAAGKTIREGSAAKRGDLSLSFEMGSAVLTATARDNARAFAEALKRPELASRRVMIEGHTDAQGSRELNLELSKRRAQAVADYLAELGVSADRLEVKGFGFDRPLPGRSAASGDNRRVEAVLTS